jgi:hypothetical protein
LLGCRHLRRIRGGVDFFEILTKEHFFREKRLLLPRTPLPF